jgi:ribosomal protein S8
MRVQTLIQPSIPFLLKNAILLKKCSVDVPYSCVTSKLLKALTKAGFIRSSQKVKSKKKMFLKVFLKYDMELRSGINGLANTSMIKKRENRLNNKLAKRVKKAYYLPQFFG